MTVRIEYDRYRPLIRWILAVTMLLHISGVQGASLEELRERWREADSSAGYKDVSRQLIDYRLAERFSKTAEVDYMIATSLCRVPDLQDAGYNHFDWILTNYNLESDSRKDVVKEQSRCRVSGMAPIPLQTAFASLPGQASSVRSKLFYWLGREDAAVNTEPVTIIDPKTKEELLSRLFAPDEQTAAVEKIGDLVGASYDVLASSNFVVASAGDHSRADLRDISVLLEQFMGFYVSAFDMRYPEYLVTVYLLPDVNSMRVLAEDLHGIKVNANSIGYAFRDDLSILGVIPGRTIGTLAHELFHVMVRDRYGDSPPWLDEGVASLYEVSNVSGKYLPTGRDDTGPATPPLVGNEFAIRGVPNWRGCVIRNLWLERLGPTVVRPTITDMVTMDWQEFNSVGSEEVAQQAMHHATARYLTLYLQDQGKLFEIFTDFTQRDPFELKRSVDADALERIQSHLGNDLEQADVEFEQWLRTQLLQDSCD